MKHKTTKAIVSSLLSAAMLVTSMPAVIPETAFAEYDVVTLDLEKDPIILPWRLVESQPAAQAFSVEDNALKVTVYYPVGTNDRSDLQLRARGLQIQAGHEYTVSGTIKTDADGYIYSRIGDYSGNTDCWHALGGAEWMPALIKEGEPFEFSQTFTATENMEAAEWAFYYADNIGSYGNPDTGMPEGSSIWFSDLKLHDNTEGAICETEKPDLGIVRPKSNVRINQHGYSSKLTKKASYCTDNKEPCQFELRDSSGKAVYTGTASAVVEDRSAGNTATEKTPFGQKRKDSGK
ncbi:MAG: carbohydrate binding domain-containing protein, partial [Ruminococcus sp.]|nr:carbohydrate binding domain-containing protein [Ruminococcus sp.]